MNLLRQECKMNLKTLFIWALSVGGLCLGCLLLYDSVEDSIAGMSDAFAGMGAFSEALGMDKIGIGTLEGYYAVEISILLSLGGAMYAAMLGAGMMAKEEEGHTCEFLHALPLGRNRIMGEKYGALVLLLTGFHVICVALILTGFAWMGSMPDMGYFIKYHCLVFLLCLETGTVCFLLSALQRRRPIGAAIGLTLLLYMADLLGRVVPALEKVKYITPFSYSNGADIFSGTETSVLSCGIGIFVTLLSLFAAFYFYGKRDLS